MKTPLNPKGIILTPAHPAHAARLFYRWRPVGVPSFANLLLLTLLLTAAPLAAQTFTVLHAFTNSPDGNGPFSGLLLSGGTLYGTTRLGGTSGSGINGGIVFSVNTDGTGYTILHDFSSDTNGGDPWGGLVISGDTLYGTGAQGGMDWGTVFSLKTNGTGFALVHSFDPSTEVPFPHDRLTLSGTTLFGTTGGFGYGYGGWGGVFSVNTDGTNFTPLYVFSAPSGNPLTNADGEQSQGGVALSGDTLYGAAFGGGPYGYGTVYSVGTNGTGFTLLYAFAGAPDGANPQESPVLSGGTLFGTTQSGGTNGKGTVYSINTDRSGYQVLHSFQTNGVDGMTPWASLVPSGNTLYGTTRSGGGTNSNGTVFSINTDGSRYTILHSFLFKQGASTNTDGMLPYGDLIISGNTLYGTTQRGGPQGYGTVFSLTVPVLAIASFNLSGTTLTINGLNGQAGATCVVLASTSLSLPLNQWSPVATNALSASGPFTITAPNAVDASARQQFFVLQMH